ncbi:MAG: hypothetical protein Q4A15_02460 [Prevotellaceae bacterium]|nr:hypothetical protein [Prevotellaceae bacterium]
MIVHESMLDANQMRFICLKSEKYVLLVGCVKSGKTICLLHKCKQLLANNPHAEVLWLTPYSLYKSFLGLAFKKLGIKCKLETINEFLKNDNKNYDYVFVDEASFLTEGQLLKIASVTTKSLVLSITEGDILPAYFFKDDEKGIDAEIISTHFGITPQCLFFMHVNNGTKKLISKLYEDKAIVSECIVDNYLHNCRCKEITNGESVEEFMMRCIVHRNEDNVGIIYFTNDEVSESYRKFKELKYKVECKYSCAIGLKNNINFDTTLPKLLTIHSSVGISFDIVYIVLNERVACNIEGYRDLIAYALTRGLHDVVIVSNSSLPQIIKDNTTPIYDGNVILEI